MKDGRIYVLSNESMPGLVKIGWTSRSVENRVRELATTGGPTKFKIEYEAYFREPAKVEQNIYQVLTSRGVRTNSKREFFEIAVSEAISLVQSFQEFCVTGDTAITFETPSANAQGRRGCKKIAIDQLWDKWHNGAAPIPSRWSKEKIRIPLRDRMKSMLIRVFDEDSRTFVTSTITDVFRTGIKPVFEVELYNGKKIKCTKEHKFLTQDGFLPLEDAVGLEVRGNTAVMTRPDTAIACNGIVVYQDPQWLRDAKTASILNGTGLAGIADAAGCTIHTIRKWLKNHGLQFTKKEVAQYTTVWNKGASGYNLPKHRAETIEKMRAKARKGAESNLWRGGADRSERLRIADWCYANRSSFLRKADYKCNRCSSTESLELHHVLTVAERPDLAYEPSNIEVLCKACHDNHHNLSGDHKVWREKSRGNALTVRWSKVNRPGFCGGSIV